MIVDMLGGWYMDPERAAILQAGPVRRAGQPCQWEGTLHCRLLHGKEARPV